MTQPRLRTTRILRVTLLTLLTLVLLLDGLTAAAQPSLSRHLALGMPTSAVTDVNSSADYLIVRDQYALSYHRDRGIPNWVSWHLQASDLGDVPRYSGPFITDLSLPANWYRVTHNDYTNSGYDRGHMTPSADRSATEAANEATFLLTNILPQAPANNQGLWATLEEHARSLVRAGNEVYVVAGGTGSRGTLANGRLTIPANVWKVMLVLPAADGDDRARITPSTPVIALWTPNDATVDGRAWQDYQTTVRCVEERTGLNFFAAVDRAVQDALEGPGCPEPAPAPAPAPPPSPAADQRCFPETGQCIHGPIRAYWERNGGLAIFGFPITTQRAEAVEGQTLQVQWFERDRIEIQATGAVTTGRLGVERLAQLGTPWQPGPGAPAGPGCTTFAVTGHTVCEPFLRSWQTQGGLERFGLPVTGAFTMELEGRPYTVQFFERRRFEAHPELGPSTVLLGLLGREVLEAQPGQPAVPPPPPPAAPPPAAPQPTTAPPPPPAAPQPTPAPAQLPPSFNNCADDPNAAAAPHAPVRIRAIDKRAETVTLQNVSTATVTLDGWIMCSVRGAQRHPIGGVLAPNESRVFPGPPENIWNNSSSDPGSLYDPAGRLVSYWPD